jgi:putative Ca2+/H+ antiporter (TMEM165/GDT1 family)
LDALLTSFIAAALGHWGDKTQWLVAALAKRYRRPRAILLGTSLAAIANALIAGIGGSLLHGLITPRAISLLLAMAFLFAGVEGLLGRRPKPMGETWRQGPFLTAFFCFFVFGFADKSQFITATLAAQFNAPLLAAAGAAAGTIASSIPAALLGERFGRIVPVKPIRIGIGILFLLTAFVLAVNALRLT